MNKVDRIRTLFDSIDAKDTEAFASHLSDDVLFRFGNAEPAEGKEAAKAAVAGFFESIEGLRHELTNIWDVGEAIVCHGMVTYTRRDSSTLRVPFANIFRLEGSLIAAYLIFADISELYE